MPRIDLPFASKPKVVSQKSVRFLRTGYVVLRQGSQFFGPVTSLGAWGGVYSVGGSPHHQETNQREAAKKDDLKSAKAGPCADCITLCTTDGHCGAAYFSQSRTIFSLAALTASSM